MSRLARLHGGESLDTLVAEYTGVEPVAAVSVAPAAVAEAVADEVETAVEAVDEAIEEAVAAVIAADEEE